MTASCLFCRIVSGEIPATIIRQDEHCVAFRDINPQAPVHVLVIPRVHVESLDALVDDAVAARVLAMASEVARQEGIATTGYRTVFNTNAAAGQTVFHLHAHVLGGRALAWPPG